MYSYNPCFEGDGDFLGSPSSVCDRFDTRGGRNGKSLLVDSMAHALSEKGYYHPLQASFLPSSSKPCPDLLNLRGKRFACAHDGTECEDR